MAETLKFKKGNEASLSNVTPEPGTLYYCEDTGNTYIGKDGTLDLYSSVFVHSEDAVDVTTIPLDADTLGGRPAQDYATETFVAAKIAEAQLGGGTGGSIDLTGYATKDDLANINLDSLGAAAADNVITLTTATTITENTNLNDIKAPGVYRCASSSVISTLENCPTQKFFKMYVGDPVAITTNDKYISQEIIESYTGTRYYRYSYDDSWVSWKTTYDSNNITTARQKISFLGEDPSSVLAENDTPANWIALGSGHAYISDWKKLPTQPKKFGFIENIVYGNLVKQIWHSQDQYG